MYSENRCQHRTIKLEERGWKRIEEGIADNRDIKIDYILNNQITFQRTPEFIPIIRRNINPKINWKFNFNQTELLD
jgi:hypothetical protein